jgi:hypothetical protein
LIIAGNWGRSGIEEESFTGRLLDPENDSATLITLEKAALVLGKQLQVALV